MASTLLVADESQTIRRLIDLTLAPHDIRTVGVGDGPQAVESLSATRPDAALISLSLPKQDGFSVVQFIRNEPALQGLPILFMAGAFDTFDEDRVRGSGGTGVLVKPFESGQLVLRIKELLKPNGSASRVKPTPVTSEPAPVVEPTPVAAAPAPMAEAEPVVIHQLNCEEEWLTESPNGMPGPAPIAPPFGAADAFAVLLAQEQGEAPAALPALPVSAPPLNEELLDKIAEKVAARMMEGVLGTELREAVQKTSERLVREEIQRIRATAQTRRY